MSKLDELRRGAGGNVAESMGAGVARRSPADGMSVPIGGARYQDLVKAKNTFEVPNDKIVPDPNQPRKVFTPEDLQPIEQAEAFRGLIDARNWTAARLAEEVHIRDSTVFKALVLLELPGEVRERVAAGKIKPATAYALSQLDRSQDQVELAERVVAEKLTRDEAAAAVREKTGRRVPPTRKGRVDIRLGGGRKVTVSRLADDRPETVVAALKHALKQIQERAREADQGEAA